MASRQRYVFRDFNGNDRTVQTFVNSAFDGLSLATALQSLSAAALVAATGPYTLADTGLLGAPEAYGDVNDRLALTFGSGLGGTSTFLIPAPLVAGVFLPDQESADLSPGGLVATAVSVFLARARDQGGYLPLRFVDGKRVRTTRPPGGDAMQLIRAVDLAATQAIIDLGFIPPRFFSLFLLTSLLTDQATNPNVLIQFNGDAAANYAWRDGSGNSDFAATGLLVARPDGTGNNPTSPDSNTLWIPNYTSGMLKAVHGIREVSPAGFGPVAFDLAGVWAITSIISSAQLVIQGGGNFLVPSKAHLYGLL